MVLDFTIDDSIRETIRSVSSKFDSSYWREVYRAGRFPEEYWSSLARAGLFGILIEKKWGGLEKGVLDLSLAVEETAERYSGIASYLYLSGSLVSKVFSSSGSDEQKSLLPKLARGEIKISIALTEEVSGMDASAIETKASKISDDEYVLNGSKMFVNNVDRADYLILFARTASSESAGKKSLGVSMFLVDAKDPSIKTLKLEKLGMDFINNFAVEIRELRAKSSQMIGEPGRAWYNMVGSFNMDRVVTSASLVGTGKLALSQASKWARERKVFGRPIGMNQGVQFPLADSAAQLETAHVMTLKAASMADQGKNFVNEANYALLVSSNAAMTATDRALQTLGGHGYYKDNDVERYWRDVRVHRVHPISEELLLAAIAERSLGLPKSY